MTLTQLSMWLTEAPCYADHGFDGYSVKFLTFKKRGAPLEIEVTAYTRVERPPLIWITNRVRRLATPSESKLILVEAAMRGEL